MPELDTESPPARSAHSTSGESPYASRFSKPWWSYAVTAFGCVFLFSGVSTLFIPIGSTAEVWVSIFTGLAVLAMLVFPVVAIVVRITGVQAPPGSGRPWLWAGGLLFGLGTFLTFLALLDPASQAAKAAALAQQWQVHAIADTGLGSVPKPLA